jgi:hypothetical protein
MSKLQARGWWVVAVLLGLVGMAAAQVKVGFALERDVYQTNETIPVFILRGGAPLAAGTLTVALVGGDGSSASFAFPVVASAGARSEHLNFDARLLRPGDYTATIAVDGQSAALPFAVTSHVRRSSYRIVNWGSRAKGAQHATQGEHSLGYNLVMQGSGAAKVEVAQQMRGGVDWTSCCTMSGGHQMDLRSECDWSDPYVIAQGGTRRVMKDVFGNRTAGNAIGSHFYDEPGLTWWKDPVTGDFTPHMVPAQVRTWEAAFGQPPLRYNELDPKNPDHVRRWHEWATWKLGFMSAAWADAAFAVNYVRPDYLAFTQSQYGFSAFTDGYYFNVVDSLPLVSGHGGYHDWGPGYWHPSWTLDMARARDLAKPCWYMPLWYHNTTSDETRLEQYLSFATGIQGLMTPPPMDPAADPFKLPSFDGVVESNHLMLRLGTIFTTQTETHSPVAMLFSLSDMVQQQATENIKAYYAHETKQGTKTALTWLAGKLRQRTFQPIVDEDVVDGTLAARHRAVILTSMDYLAPEVLDGLAAFIAAGGKVFATADSEVQVPGAIVIPLTPGATPEEQQRAEAAKAELKKLADQQAPLNAQLKDKNEALKKGKDLAEAAKTALQDEIKALQAQRQALVDAMAPHQAALSSVQGMRGALVQAERYAKALEPLLAQAGIAADATSSEPGIGVQRQGAGDVQYHFILNATHDYDAPEARGAQLGIKAVETDLALPAGGVLYDAVLGGPAAGFTASGSGWRAHLRLGPGQLRVYAQAARPIGGVQVATPVLHHDFTVREAPLTVALAATVLAAEGGVLSGSLPLRIVVTDPLGAVRYDLYRATAQGQLRLVLPLAANDPAGRYNVRVTELLANTSGAASFDYAPAARAAGLAGTTRRALLFDRDVELIHRFFRVHQDVTIVLGQQPGYRAAAERIAGYLQPWAVRATIVEAAAVNRGKTITEAMATSFTGLNYTARGTIKVGDENPPAQVGFAVEGPVILLGTPEDNPLIKHLLAQDFLPVTPSAAGVPGAGRGLICYQRDAIGARQDSIALIAYDEAGMAEAVGHLAEVMAGLKPLTPWTLPRQHQLAPAKTAAVVPPLTVAWTTALPDKADALQLDGERLVALTHDGSQVTVAADGRIAAATVLGEAKVAELAASLRHDPLKLPADLKALASRPGYLLRHAVANGQVTGALYVGGTVRLLAPDGTPLAEHCFAADPLHALWLGDRLVVALSDGTLAALARP